VGALYIREGRNLTPLVHGAAQENGMRAGTENVALAVGLGAACRIAQKRLEDDSEKVVFLRNRLQDLLSNGIKGLVQNGHPEFRLPNTLNVSVPGLDGSQILVGAPNVIASTGAACHDKTVRLSHVLSAMGISPEIGMGALRFTLGRKNTLSQIEEAAQSIINQVRRMR